MSNYIRNHSENFSLYCHKYIEASKAYRLFLATNDASEFPGVDDRHQGTLYLTGQKIKSILVDYKDYLINSQITKEKYIEYLQEFNLFIQDKNLYTVDSLGYDFIKSEINKYLIAA